jgi:hypothetical protein
LSLALAACNSDTFSNGLRPTSSLTTGQTIARAPQPAENVGSETALAPSQNTAPAAARIAQSTNRPPAGNQMASVPRVDPVAFLPVTGAPQAVVTKLAASMRSAAESYAVPVVVSVDRGARYQIKGYFSAMGGNTGTTLIYVWDILDKNGVRVHRISGQEHGPPTGGDPWDAIGSDTINRVAQSTMASLRSWVSSGNSG